MRWQSIVPPASWTSGATERSTTGPIVTGGTKWPSPTSKWKTRAPARSKTSISSPRRVKSAAYNEGSISTVRIQSRHATEGQSLSGEAGDEEAARAVQVGTRQQELRTARMAIRGPLVRERRVRSQLRGVDDRFVLVGVERAD